MSARRLFVTGIVAFVAAGLTLASVAQNQQRRKGRKSPTRSVNQAGTIAGGAEWKMPPPGSVPPQPQPLFTDESGKPAVFTFELKIKPRDHEEQVVTNDHVRAAEILNQAKVMPNERRIQHFQWLNDTPYRVVSWGAFVRSVDNTAEGTLVTLRVAPSIADFDTGRTGFSYDYTLETYLLQNGHVSLINVVDPPDARRSMRIY
jgi:hypothetical protein